MAVFAQVFLSLSNLSLCTSWNLPFETCAAAIADPLLLRPVGGLSWRGRVRGELGFFVIDLPSPPASPLYVFPNTHPPSKPLDLGFSSLSPFSDILPHNAMPISWSCFSTERALGPGLVSSGLGSAFMSCVSSPLSA